MMQRIYMKAERHCKTMSSLLLLLFVFVSSTKHTHILVKMAGKELCVVLARREETKRDTPIEFGNIGGKHGQSMAQHLKTPISEKMTDP